MVGHAPFFPHKLYFVGSSAERCVSHSRECPRRAEICQNQPADFVEISPRNLQGYSALRFNAWDLGRLVPFYREGFGI